MKDGYCLFVCEEFYPFGGWNDYVGNFDSKEEAISFLKNEKNTDRKTSRTAHIVHDFKIIWAGIFNERFDRIENTSWVEINEN